MNLESFKELIDIKEWQKIQDNFSEVTGVSLRTVDPKGRRITTPSNEPRLCVQFKEKSPHGSICLPTFLGGRGIVDKNLSFTCQSGFYNFVTALKVNDNAFAYVVIGPLILVIRKGKEEYRRLAEELEVSLDELWSAILEIKVVSFQGAQSMVELIKDVGESMLKLAYQNKAKKKEGLPETILNLIRLLDVLLDVSVQASGADTGSIMLVNKSRNELIIKASRGIPEDIVKNTRVKLGDGISGIAAKEKVPFLIEDRVTADNRIKAYLNRPSLGSSMVIPLKIGERVLAVVNLGTLKNSPVRFNKNNLQMINQLIELVTAAIAPQNNN